MTADTSHSAVGFLRLGAGCFPRLAGERYNRPHCTQEWCFNYVYTLNPPPPLQCHFRHFCTQFSHRQLGVAVVVGGGDCCLSISVESAKSRWDEGFVRI